MRAESFLTVGERELVRATVAEAEKLTSAELRVLIVGSSPPRPVVGALAAGALLGGATYFALHVGSWGHPGLIEILTAAATGLMLATAIHFLWPSSAKSVWQRAQREFTRFGMAKTAGATGVLIMLSLKEHRAVVYADKGILEKVPAETWTKELEALTACIKAGKPGEGIAGVLRNLGALLSGPFPRRDDDVNELPDDVITRK